MANKDFGVKKIELIGSSGTPNLTSPTNLNLNANTVAISTDVTIGGKVQSNVIVGTGYSVGIGSTLPQQALDVGGTIRATGFVKSDGSAIGAGDTANIVTGIITATTYYGDGSNLSGISNVSVADTAPSPATDNSLWWSSALAKGFIRYNDGNSSQWVEFSPSRGGIAGLSTTGNSYFTNIDVNNQSSLTNLNVSGVATFSGNVTIGGTLTYEDVTNVDSVGLITARNGIDVTGHTELDNLNVSGVSTFPSVAQLTPTGSGTIDIGSASNRWGTAYLSDLYLSGSRQGTITVASDAYTFSRLNFSGDYNPAGLDLKTGNNNSYYILPPETTSSALIITLPSTSSSANSLLVAEDSGGTLKWENSPTLSNLNVTGVSTFSNKLHVDSVGSGVTYTEDLVVVGNARVTGILSIGTSSIVFDANSNEIRGINQIHLGSPEADERPVIVKQTGGKVSFVKTQIVNGRDVETNEEVSVGIGTTASINTTGIITASSFVGPVTGNASSATVATNAQGLTGSPSITVTDITATGNVSIAGTLTYEDVTNIDSVGLITARSGINATGVVTATSFDGDLTGTATTATNLNNQAASYYLDYNNFTNTPTIPTNNNQLTNGAGYITSADGGNAATVDGIDSTSFLRSDAADQKTSGTLRFNDNIILSLGTGDDAEFFVDGSHMYLDLNSGIGNFYIRDDTTTRFTFDDAGDFTATGNVTAYSDITLKKNIELIPNALDKVLGLRGVTYNRIDIENEPKQSGVIAQEVEKVLPEVVITNEEGIKSVAYGNMVGLLIEAIKELKEEVETLKDEIKNLKNA